MLKNPALNIFTSKNNTEIHREYFEKLAEAGHRNIIHFTISYQLANTRDNAVQAAEMVKEKYPDFNLVPIESHTTTVCQGMLVKMAVKLRDEGKTLQEAVDLWRTKTQNSAFRRCGRFVSLKARRKNRRNRGGNRHADKTQNHAGL